MLVKMSKKDFDLLALSNLSQECFEPLIKIYKNRVAEQTSFNVSQIKEQFYEELTEGQRALFMFYAYYNHVSKSLIEFYWWSAYFMAQPRSWLAIKTGIKYFDDKSMLSLLERIEVELKRHNHPDTLENFTVKREDLERNKELQASFKLLYEILDKTSSLTINKINECIGQNHQDFLEIED
ncbi:hypothetical protein CWR48_16250 [Oceanobacillus arenosus]|uniref:Uncharacterized protein n=1 Tax=Oceanobacillus arenosus TaxID=1229153 RepID=A0A3D8PMX8_9BACI|nr:hypothetical protein [Oceanobacillus arenosus]RDW16591.1 hypothetical protein CWR48_16250 [Oceanobacillus arenosus]